MLNTHLLQSSVLQDGSLRPPLFIKLTCNFLNLTKAVTATFSKINSLTNKVSNLESVLKMHNERFGNLEVNNDSDSGGGLGRKCSSNQGDPKVMLSKENVKKDSRKENLRKSKAMHERCKVNKRQEFGMEFRPLQSMDFKVTLALTQVNGRNSSVRVIEFCETHFI